MELGPHFAAGEAMGKRFYFTAHAGDLSRKRLPEGCRVMVVAAAFWDQARGGAGAVLRGGEAS